MECEFGIQQILIICFGAEWTLLETLLLVFCNGSILLIGSVSGLGFNENEPLHVGWYLRKVGLITAVSLADPGYCDVDFKLIC